MALGFIDKLKARFVGSGSKKLEQQVASHQYSARPKPQEPPKPRTWGQIIIDSLPLAVLIIGGLMTAFTQLIKDWAILGYMLLCTAPILHLLMRIDRNLKELNRRIHERE